jgi:hypothetical protein
MHALCKEHSAKAISTDFQANDVPETVEEVFEHASLASYVSRASM